MFLPPKVTDPRNTTTSSTPYYGRGGFVDMDAETLQRFREDPLGPFHNHHHPQRRRGDFQQKRESGVPFSAADAKPSLLYHPRAIERAPVLRDRNGFTADSIFYKDAETEEEEEEGKERERERERERETEGRNHVLDSKVNNTPSSQRRSVVVKSKNSIFDASSSSPSMPRGPVGLRKLGCGGGGNSGNYSHLKKSSPRVSKNNIFNAPPSDDGALLRPPPALTDPVSGGKPASSSSSSSTTSHLPPSASTDDEVGHWSYGQRATWTANSRETKEAASVSTTDTATATITTGAAPSRIVNDAVIDKGVVRQVDHARGFFAREFGKKLGRSMMSLSSPVLTPPPVVPDSDPHPLLKAAADLSLFFLPTKKNFLGEGRNAQVFLATYTTATDDEPKPCAVKRVHANPESQSLALAESFILNRLSPRDHPNIIKLVGVKDEAEDVKKIRRSSDAVNTGTAASGSGSASNGASGSASGSGSYGSNGNLGSASSTKAAPRLLLLLEYCSRGSMWDWLACNSHLVGRKLWIKWAKELTGALAFVHESKIVHHDLKPHNIMLDEFLNSKISDFGTSAFTSSSSPLSDGLGRGTPAYSPPELISTTATYDASVDIFSLAVTLYVVGFTGQEPYRTVKNPVELLVWVRKAGFMEWEERQRQVDLDSEESGCGSSVPTSPTSLSPTSPVRMRFLTPQRGTGSRSPSPSPSPSPTSPTAPAFPNLTTGSDSSPRENIPFDPTGESPPSFTSSVDPSNQQHSKASTSTASNLPRPRSSRLPSSVPLYHPSIRFLNGEPVDTILLDLLRRCTQKDPRKRPTASEFNAILCDLDWGVDDPGLAGGGGFEDLSVAE